MARLGGSSSFRSSLQYRLSLRQAGRCDVQALVGQLARWFVRRVGPGDRRALLGPPRDGPCCLREMLVLALQVTPKLGQPPFDFAPRRKHPLQFLFELAASVGEPL